jgi:L-ascorbate metabolism protein UlaG (beta-lactamase superfamily)
MAIANWLFEVGDTRIVMDGWITRPIQVRKPDVFAVHRVLHALGENEKVDYILTGHSHIDHALDTATWAKLTGAQIIGSRTTCFQAFAQGVPESQCTIVSGGEVLNLGRGVTVRVVRWQHSGDIGGPLQTPVELDAIPTLEPDGSLPANALPNGGGGRAYLFTVDTTAGPINWFYADTDNDRAFDLPLIADGEDFGTPRNNLMAAMAEAGLTGVDLWIGGVGNRLAVAQNVVPVLQPKAFIPHHWDDFPPFFPGLPFPFSDTPDAAAVEAFVTGQGIQFLPQHQYMDKYVLDVNGIIPVPNSKVKQELGFSDVQEFE